MDALCRQEGTTPTPLPGVRLHRTSRNIVRAPLLYAQGIIIVGQGSKMVHLGDKVHVYDPEHYLVLSVPLPAECEAVIDPAKPLLSMVVDIDMELLRGIIGQLEERRETLRPGCTQKGLYLARADAAFKDTTARLLHALASPDEARVLGRGLVRELLFRVLQGENAAALYALAAHNTGLSRIDKALRQIHENFNQSFNVEQLAEVVNMSPSAFHRAFKEVTAQSPIQYLKRVRLNKAKSLLVESGLRSSDAARLVGYESVSQFNREFKRYFGASPRQLPELAGWQ
jgi:AraC-like DNA-binding protein